MGKYKVTVVNIQGCIAPVLIQKPPNKKKQ